MATRKREIQMIHCICERCGHQWDTRKLPTACAKCKSAYWNVKKNNGKD